MQLTERVEKLQKELRAAESQQEDALREAEKLADQYADIKPAPYVVPIERLTGLPTQVEPEKNA